MAPLGSFWAAFLVGGVICLIGQLMMDLTRFTPAHVLSLLVVLGAVLDGLGLYEPLIRFAGAGVYPLPALEMLLCTGL